MKFIKEIWIDYLYLNVYFYIIGLYIFLYYILYINMFIYYILVYFYIIIIWNIYLYISIFMVIKVLRVDEFIKVIIKNRKENRCEYWV